MKNYDEIHIENLQIHGNHGVYPEETSLGQRFLISAVLYCNTREAGLADDLALSTNYGEVCHFLTEYLQNHTYKLIEAAAENAVMALLTKFPLLAGVSLEIKKPWAPIGLPLDYVSVRIERFWHRAYIALGSNMGDKKAYLDGGISRLSQLAGCRIDRVSDYIITKPYGGVAQDDFLNGCLSLDTVLSPEKLLFALQEIEAAANRKRTVHWGPRTLDLDILLYDDMIYESENLTIPHEQMHLRDFVLEPLCQIAPTAYHPIFHKTARKLLAELTN